MNFDSTSLSYSQDMAVASSQSTTMIQNGATFEQSYIIMKLKQNMIHSFYFPNRPIVKQ